MNNAPKTAFPAIFAVAFLGASAPAFAAPQPPQVPVEKRVKTLTPAQAEVFSAIVRDRATLAQECVWLEGLASSEQRTAARKAAELFERYGVSTNRDYVYHADSKVLAQKAVTLQGESVEISHRAFSTDAEAEAFLALASAKSGAADRAALFEKYAAEKRAERDELVGRLEKDFGVKAESQYRFDSSNNAIYEVIPPEVAAKEAEAAQARAKAEKEAKEKAVKAAAEKAKAEKEAREKAEREAKAAREKAAKAAKLAKEKAEATERAEKAGTALAAAQNAFDSAKRTFEARKAAVEKAEKDLKTADRAYSDATSLRKTAAKAASRAAESAADAREALAKAEAKKDSVALWKAREAATAATSAEAAAKTKAAAAEKDETTAKLAAETARTTLKNARPGLDAAERAFYDAEKKLRNARREADSAKSDLSRFSK